jgi:hypothetical protein
MQLTADLGAALNGPERPPHRQAGPQQNQGFRAFSSEAGTGSRQENASKQKPKARF